MELQKPTTCLCETKRLNISWVDFWELIIHTQEISIKLAVFLVNISYVDLRVLVVIQ